MVTLVSDLRLHVTTLSGLVVGPIIVAVVVVWIAGVSILGRTWKVNKNI